MVKVSCLVVAGLACGSALAASETLQVNENTVIPAEGAAYTGIVFTGPYTLSGGKITLSAGARIEQASACAATISCGLEVAEGATAFFIANAGGSYAVSGVLSGAGSFATGGDGGGTYTFSGDNTFTGDMNLTNGVAYHMKSEYAFGRGTSGKVTYAANENKTCAYVSPLYFYGNVTIEKDFDEYAKDTYGFVFTENSRTVFRGTVTAKFGQYRPQYKANAHVVFEKELVNYSGAYWIPSMPSGSSCTFKELFAVSMFSVGSNKGRIVLEKGVKIGSSFYLPGDNGTGVITICPEDGIVDNNGNPGVIDFRDGRQTIDFVKDCRLSAINYTSGTPNANAALSSTNGATFRYVGTGSTFYGKIRGDLGLSVESGTFTLNGASDTTGAISVKAGARLTVSDTAVWVGTDYAVDGTLELRGGKGVPKNATIRIDEKTGKLVLGKNAVITLEGAIYVGETKLPSGTYGGGQGGDYGKYFEGEGQIILTSGDIKTDYTWDGGGEDDTSAETGANWEGDEKPDFSSGLVTATFATGGTKATFANAAKLKGMILSLPAGQTDFAFDGEGRLSLLSDGLSAVPTSADATARTYAFGLPLALLASQEWKLDDANAVLDFSGMKLSGEGVTLVKTGASVVRLGGNNDFKGSTLSFDGGRLEATGDRVFGDADTKVTLLNTKSDTVFAPSNCTFRQTIALEGNNGGLNGSKGLVVFPACCTNVFCGKVTQSTILRPTFGANSLTEFRGGYEAGTYIVWSSAELTSRVVFRETPCKFGNLSMRGFVEFAVACTNKAANTYFGLNGNCTALLSAPWVFDCTSPIYFEPWGSGISTLDITGGDQRFGSLGWTVGTSYTPHRSVTVKCSITASSNAVMHVVQEHDCDWWCAKFTGLVGLDKEGSKMLMLSNSVSTATGPVRVSAGTLAFHPSASWTTASSVTVTNGTLRLLGDEQIGRKADWYLAGNAQVEIPSGKVLRGHRLYLKNGDAWEEQCGGDYTSANCPFIKSGTLRVSGSGLLLLMR